MNQESGYKNMGKNQKTTCILTIILGMMITLVRVVMPMHFEITTNIVILETILELSIGIAVVWLNRKALKEAFKRKFTKKDCEDIVKYWAIVYIAVIIFLLVASFTYQSITGQSFNEVTSGAPAAFVGEEFKKIFPIGVIMTMCITAPIVEEIVFRMTFKNVIKNNILFILISSLLFGFIHTANFFTLGIIEYFFCGCLFAAIYLKTKDIRITIGTHMLYNIMLFVFPLLSGLFSWIIAKLT